jgi:mannonate dehydratase
VYVSFRWLGPRDPVALQHIAQIPGVRSAVAALYDIPPGRLWPVDAIQALKGEIEAVGLGFEVVESLPVHEDIKLGRPDRDELLAQYSANVARLGTAGVSVVVYNFMPLFDWFRTDLAMPLPDGSTTLGYDEALLDATADPWGADWPAYFPLDEPPDALRAAYRDLGEDDLRANLVHFLQQVVPAAEEAGVVLGIHPDDPPWSIFGIPRVVKNRADLAFLLDAVDRPANGLTLCVGSLGADPANDPPALARELAPRIHFVHGRNVRHTGHRRFHEVAHPPEYGDVDLVAVLRALHEAGYTGPIRADHGRMIWGETGTNGYGLYDRALGAAFLNGVWHGLGATKATGATGVTRPKGDGR